MKKHLFKDVNVRRIPLRTHNVNNGYIKAKEKIVLIEKKENSPHVVFKRVVEMIVSREINPGDLLYETSVAADTGLSRTPVREAFVRLVSEGFLEQKKGKRGYIVPSLTLEDMQDVFHARECLEQKIAFLAAENAVKSDIELLEQINDDEIENLKMEKNAVEHIYEREGEAYGSIEANVRFHLSLAQIADNRYLERAYEMIYWRSHLYTHYIISLLPLPEEVEKIFQNRRHHNVVAAEHADMIKAISMRDGEKASDIALKHIRNTTAYMIAFKCPGVKFFSGA